LSAGDSPHSPLGELTALPQTLLAVFRMPTSKRRRGGEERGGREFAFALGRKKVGAYGSCHSKRLRNETQMPVIAASL